MRSHALLCILNIIVLVAGGPLRNNEQNREDLKYQTFFSLVSQQMVDIVKYQIG